MTAGTGASGERGSVVVGPFDCGKGQGVRGKREEGRGKREEARGKGEEGRVEQKAAKVAKGRGEREE